MAKVQLILPSMDSAEDTNEKGWWQPLGLLSLATYLKTHEPNIDVEIINGDGKIGADFVGIQPSIASYGNSLKSGEIAKQGGAKVIFGGHHATPLAENILKNRKFVDYVGIYEAEELLLALVKGKDPSQIPNLVSRYGRGPKLDARRNLDEIPFPDFSFIELEPYFKNYRRIYPQTGFQRPISLYSQRGCMWREKTKGCIFCGRMDEVWKGRDPKSVWDYILGLKEKYNIDLIVDSSDDFTTNESWFEAFYKLKPNEKIAFRIYSRSDKITEDTSRKLYDIGVRIILFGIESGDENCLRECRKGMTLQDHIRAAEFINQYGIQMCPSFVFGFPGENEESIGKTLKYAEKLSKYRIETTHSSILTPLPGSIAFAQLLSNPPMQEKYGGKDELSIVELQQDWLRIFCPKVGYDRLLQAQQEISKILPRMIHILSGENYSK